mmetsp:Transcript_31792/g.69557  ORF Transcript_31792/g.69557 Transcript_31792/m.69557 type:complete len:93 (+) Transcript_31792:29-307(+)
MKFLVMLVAAVVGHYDRQAHMEESIITSLGNCPLCAGHEQCLGDCRRKEHRSWNECLNRCLHDDPFLQNTLSSMIVSTGSSLDSFGSADSEA